MSVEFVDTNVLIYAHDSGAGKKHERSVELIARLYEGVCGALSVQVLAEFYAAATRKLAMKSEEAVASIEDLGSWIIHRPGHADILRAARLHRRYKLSWWDSMILNSAIESGCNILWTEDFSDGHRYDSVTVRNPFQG
jgi:predicted nucleic acid-binding protein